MTSVKTEKCVAEMVAYANEGNKVYPAFFTPYHGRATVSAAVRVAVASGAIREAGKDGVGKPVYEARTVNKNSPWYKAA